MKKIISILVLLYSLGVKAQHTDIFTKRIQVKDSLKLGTKWYKTLVDVPASYSEYNIVRDGGADTTGVVNAAPIIQSAINAGFKNIYIPKGTFLINNTVFFKDSVLIHGAGAASSIKISGNIKAFNCRNVLGGNFCTFKNLGFVGTLNLPTNIYSYGNRTDGGQIAIAIDTSIGVIISEVYARKINGYAFQVTLNAENNKYAQYVQNAPRGNDVVNCHVTESYGGVHFYGAAEYNRLLGGSYNNNYIAHRQYISGNNSVSNANLSGNIYGAIVEGVSPWYAGNNSHGNFTGNVINHNRTALWFKDATWGMWLSNNMVYNDWDSIKFENCDNIRIEGGYMTANGGGKFFIKNCTNFKMTNVDELLGISTVYSVIGDMPTIIQSGITPGGLTFFDRKNAKNFTLKFDNGNVNTIGDESFKITSTIATGAAPGGSGAWKLGKRVAATVVASTSEYIEVVIDGVTYKLGIVN